MNTQNSRLRGTREQIGEASVWMAKLRDPDRGLQVERGFRRWLSADPGNAAAFETVTEAWEETAGLPRIPLEVARKQRPIASRGLRVTAIAATLVAAIAGILLYRTRHSGIETEVGEQRTLTLEDGSRVVLNTDSRVVVCYDEKTRRVELTRGEALFDAAADRVRPFIVSAGRRDIRALGTSFVVRRDAKRLSVTLIDGRVSVTPPSGLDRAELSGREKLASSAVKRQGNPDAPIVLAPGERFTLDGASSTPAIDDPQVDKVIAWRRGQVDLTNMRLEDAAAEMNRYSPIKVVIEDAKTAGLRITGVFRAGDTESFGNAIADTYGVAARRAGDRILISGSPHN